MVFDKHVLKTVMVSSLVASALALGACASKEEKKDQEAAKATPHDQAMGQLATDRDAYVRSIDAKLAEYNKFSQTLRSQSQSKPKLQAKKMTNAADDLDLTTRDVTTALQEVKTSAPENWLVYKRDVEKALNRADAQYSNSTTLLQ